MIFTFHKNDDCGLFVDKTKANPYIRIEIEKGSYEEKVIQSDTMNNWYSIEGKRLFPIHDKHADETNQVAAFLLLRRI